MRVVHALSQIRERRHSSRAFRYISYYFRHCLQLFLYDGGHLSIEHRVHLTSNWIFNAGEQKPCNSEALRKDSTPVATMKALREDAHSHIEV